MAHNKNPKVDLRSRYKRFFEINLIISLALLIFAFKYFPKIGVEKVLQKTINEPIIIENVQQTTQTHRPPPPPRPAIFIEAPTNDVLKDIEISATDLNQNENVKDVPPEVKRDLNDFVPYKEYADFMPEPIGGLAAIQDKIVYPEIEKRAGVEGKILVKAYVDEKGDVTKTEIIQGVDEGLNQAAIKAVKGTKFKPGMQRGKPVKVKVVIPIVFRLR